MVSWLNRVLKALLGNTGQRSYYYRLIWVGCISVCIPIILIGGLFYYLAATSVTEQVEADTESSLVIFKEQVERILQSIELDSHQLATDPLIRESFFVPDFNQSLFYHLDILDEIQIRTLSNRLIDEIFYYNDQTGLVLSNEYGYILYDSFKYKEDIDIIMDTEQNATWLHLPKASEEGYISHARKLPVLASGSSQGLLVMQVREEPFRDYFPSEEYRSSMIVDSQNSVLFAEDSVIKDIQMNGGNAFNHIMESDSNSGTFYADDGQGNQAFYAYDQNHSFGRAYISMIPKYAITQQMSWFRWMIFSSVLFFLSIGILLTIYNTRRVYSPIKQLINYSRSLSNGKLDSERGSEINFIENCMKYLSREKQTLGNFINKIEPTLKERFFKQILEGDYVINHSFYKDCQDYQIPIQSKYLIMVVNVSNLNKMTHFAGEDKPIVTFAIKNIIAELLQNNSSLDGVELNSVNHHVVGILRFKAGISNDQIKEAVHRISTDIHTSVLKYLSLYISIGIGRVYDHISDVRLSYQEALQALQYRIFKKDDSVLLIEELDTSAKKGIFFYPRELETRIVESLKVGDLQQAERTLDEFAKTITLFESYNSIYQCFHILLSSIIRSLENQGSSIIDILEHDLFGQLKSLQTLDEVNQWFIVDLFPLYQTIGDETNISSGRLAIKQVCHFINEHISQDITLTQCAELVDLAPSYLSRLFKKEVGITFREYVLQRKIEEAKSLCSDTDHRISEIAASIGYSERNLTRLFQRYVQMTPSQYRNNHR